jgi:hypothetical protein
MNGLHPTADQLDRYRRRAATAAETIDVDAHLATCERCFEAVRADAHLTYEQLEAIADGREAPAPHLALCAACRGELADLYAMREALVEQHAPHRRWWPVAAMLAIALIAGLLMFRGDATSGTTAFNQPQEEPSGPKVAAPPQTRTVALEKPPILETLVTDTAVLRGGGRSGSFALQAPVATVVLEERPNFRWAAVPGATSYEVAVVDVDRGTMATSGTSATASWRSAAPLPRGRTYAWQVAAETSGGRIVAPGRDGPEARFHVAEQAAVEGATPLQRGVALANVGALDDAEREFEAAGAVDLLQQIRAWRQ